MKPATDLSWSCYPDGLLPTRRAFLGTLAAAAEMRMVVFQGPAVVSETPWTVREAGRFALVCDGSVGNAIAKPGRYRALIEARSPAGDTDGFITIELEAGRSTKRRPDRCVLPHGIVGEMGDCVAIGQRGPDRGPRALFADLLTNTAGDRELRISPVPLHFREP